MKIIDIKEFRERGYLQELNRRFLHPLGLALSVVINDDGTESLGDIWDCRNDPEGFMYGEINREKAVFVQQEWDKRIQYRIENLGFGVQNVIK